MYGVINENIPYIFIYFLNVYSSGFFLKEKDNENEKEKKRCRQDSNLRGKIPMDF